MKSRYLDREEVELLRAHLTIDQWLPLALSLETGLRIGDVVTRRVTDLKKDGLHYVAQKTKKKGVAMVSNAIRKHLPKSGKWLFPSPYNAANHITRQAVWSRIKRAGKAAGVDLDGVSPHSLRKVFAVELYRQKGFEAVREALQHSNAATTEIYTFADWSTGENAQKPLRRCDLELIVKMVIEALGGCTFHKEQGK